ncbi:MAG: SDR family NAD(P)-dependent oxidoreductase [Rhodobacteraceae bacterium]|nr:SDR family NAD(P)-dependent oxidoreductase [Paracoccaceae bacterium]
MERAVALVTGASRGLGRALALALGARGWQVIAVARTEGGLAELDDGIRAAGGPPATLAPLDIADPGSLRQLSGHVAGRWGGLGLLAHCAIHGPPLAPVGHIDGRDWERALAVNARATGELIALVEPLLRARPGGVALFFDDPRAGAPFFGAYGASKAAQIALARSWAAETRRLGPRVEILAPAAMATALRARFHPGEGTAGLARPAAEAARLLAQAGLDAPAATGALAGPGGLG